MYSRPIKYLISLSSLFPVFLIFWLVGIINNWKQLHFYFSLKGSDFKAFFYLHGFLLVFLLLLFVCLGMINFAKSHLSPQTIDVKAIKPADVNLVSILLSYLAPWCKFYFENSHDYIYAAGYFLIASVLAIVTSRAYHYNITFSLFFGYKHFEVSTTKEVTYLVLSKKSLINKKQLTEVVHLTDYMLINIS
ncbi:MAG: hypothetical protein V4577_14305 [Bacteroidota bacterium]